LSSAHLWHPAKVRSINELKNNNNNNTSQKTKQFAMVTVTSTTRITGEHGSFNRIGQVAPIYTHPIIMHSFWGPTQINAVETRYTDRSYLQKFVHDF